MGATLHGRILDRAGPLLQEGKMHYWLMKSEPDVFSYDDLVAKGKAEWDGVRNHAAQGHMKAMCEGDLAFFDPTTGDPMGDRDLGDSVYIAPVIADETVLVLTDEGRLIALR